MKSILVIVAAALLIPAQPGCAQGFMNLNFESANIPLSTTPGSFVPVSAGLPGWNGYFVSGAATNQASQIAYDGISIGGAVISINDTNTGFGFTPIQGRYSVYLFGQGGTPVSTAISQTGLVPSGTLSLQARMVIGGPAPIVALGGQVINMVPIATFPTYTVFAGDIASFAGQVAELTFTEPPPSLSSPSSLLLDAIVFSSSPVPEPSSLGLFVLGALVFGLVRRHES